MPEVGARALRIVAIVALVALVFSGWSTFAFLCDDAYIAFRYVSNAHAGLGFVYNPPPFPAVEGYTSFLWVVILRGLWALGVEPPDIANWLTLVCGYGTLAIGASMVWPSLRGQPRGQVLLGLALFGVATSRPFLTWLSSGLETGLFNLLLTWWVAEALRGGGVRLALAGALLALTRPDGLLFCAFSGVFFLRRPTAAWPFLLVIAHLLWRRATYGLWLPNTFYAKVAGAWPEAGLRHFAAFCFEHGVWAWVAVLPGLRGARWTRGALVAMGAVLAHLAYYVLIVGGDHFEYRIYSHLPLFLFVGAAWAAARMRGGVAVLAAVVLASWPVQWTQWAASEGAAPDREAHAIVVPIAGRFPAAAGPVMRWYDEEQRWLIQRMIGVRHVEHVAFARSVFAQYPSREEGSRLRWAEHNVVAVPSVGIIGWVLPEVAVIDLLGLNDRVIAQAPLKPGERMMAHDREAPRDYVMCFKPNTGVADGTFVHRPRELTDAQIEACLARGAGG